MFTYLFRVFIVYIFRPNLDHVIHIIVWMPNCHTVEFTNIKFLFLTFALKCEI